MVMASKDEPFGLAYIEAMACELPVIGLSSGGVPEIIQNDINGFLAPPDNHVELAKRINWIINDRKRGSKFGIEGRKMVRQKFSLNRMTEETMKVYESVVK
jgi:glycosyltransferase involved in cell wall biosynthesis